MRKLLFFLAGLFIGTIALSQHVTNVRAAMDGSNVKITYDLEHSNLTDLFEITLLADHNNFTEPLKLVSGAIGRGVKPGKDQVIIWKALEEMVNFKGQIVFEVRAAVMGGYYTITDPKPASKFKKKKLMSIYWTGGNVSEKVKIELIQANVPTSTISESVGNQGNYIWTIPKNIKPSKKYQVRISNTADISSQGVSKIFRIKGKSGAGFILLPILGGGAYAAYMLTQDGGGPGPIDNKEEPLPLPPNP